MQISITELKSNTGRYVELAERGDIIITRNGKPAARLTNAKVDRVALMETLFGVIPGDIDHEAMRMERILS